MTDDAQNTPNNGPIRRPVRGVWAKGRSGSMPGANPGTPAAGSSAADGTAGEQPEEFQRPAMNMPRPTPNPRPSDVRPTDVRPSAPAPRQPSSTRALTPPKSPSHVTPLPNTGGGGGAQIPPPDGGMPSRPAAAPPRSTLTRPMNVPGPASIPPPSNMPAANMPAADPPRRPYSQVTMSRESGPVIPAAPPPSNEHMQVTDSTTMNAINNADLGLSESVSYWVPPGQNGAGAAGQSGSNPMPPLSQTGSIPTGPLQQGRSAGLPAPSQSGTMRGIARPPHGSSARSHTLPASSMESGTQNFEDLGLSESVGFWTPKEGAQAPQTAPAQQQGGLPGDDGMFEADDDAAMPPLPPPKRPPLSNAASAARAAAGPPAPAKPTQPWAKATQRAPAQKKAPPPAAPPPPPIVEDVEGDAESDAVDAGQSGEMSAAPPPRRGGPQKLRQPANKPAAAPPGKRSNPTPASVEPSAARQRPVAKRDPEPRSADPDMDQATNDLDIDKLPPPPEPKSTTRQKRADAPDEVVRLRAQLKLAWACATLGFITSAALLSVTLGALLYVS